MMLTLASLSLLTNCKGGKDASSSSVPTGAPVGSGPVISLWICNWGNAEYESTLEKLAAQATAANIDGKGIQAKVTMISWDTFYNTFLTAVVAGEGPDIACQASTAPALYAEMGKTLDLMPILNKWKQENSPMYSEVGQAAFDFETHNGQLIAIPFALDGAGLTYNRNVFQKAGITKLPTTFDELGQDLDLIKRNCPGVAPIAFNANHSNLIEWLIFGNGGYIVSKDYKVQLNDPKVTKMLDLFKSWWDAGYIAPGSAGYSSDEIRTMIQAEQAGIVLTNMPTWAAVDKRASLGIIPPLRGPDATAGSHHNTVSYQAYYAYNTTKYHEETMAVLKWWLEHDEILYIEGGQSVVPVRSSLAKKVLADPLLNEFYDAYFNNNGIAVPFIYPFTQFENWMGVADANRTNVIPAWNILMGKSYQEGIAESTQQLNELFIDYEK
jgi:multiple sugar transport system substrate-binding protein